MKLDGHPTSRQSRSLRPAEEFLKSNGENNYYPSYSPDGQYIVFDRAPADTSVSGIDGCVGNPAEGRSCPNDSFSNPAARLMLVASAPGAAAVDLQAANGSSSTLKLPLSNSFPRWVPTVQSYKGKKLAAYLDDDEAREQLFDDGLVFRTDYPVDEKTIADKLKKATTVVDVMKRHKAEEARAKGIAAS